MSRTLRKPFVTKSQPSTLTAESYSGGLGGRIDREKNIVTGVKVCGIESVNGNRYPSQVLEKAKPKYDGLGVFENTGFHQTGQISDLPTRLKMGVLRNPTVTAEGLFADFHYNPKHSFIEQFLWSVENRPTDYGFSHVAHRTFRTDPTGVKVAESINAVHRVDIVADPATTGGVFESVKTKDNPMTGREIAMEISTAKDLDTFLAELFDALPSGAFGDTEKQAAIASLEMHLGLDDSSEDPVDAAAEDAAAESFRKPRYGKRGLWAASIISESLTTKRKTAKIAKATALCDAEKLPAHLRTEVFLDQVAESMGNEARAKALIADRIANGKPASTNPNDPPPADGSGNTAESQLPATQPPPNSPVGQDKVKSLVAGYKAGK